MIEQHQYEEINRIKKEMPKTRESSEDVRCMLAYTGSFLYDDNFLQSKRFRKYVERVRQSLNDFVANRLNSITPFSTPGFTNIYEFVKDYFTFLLINAETDRFSDDDQSGIIDWRRMQMPFAADPEKYYLYQDEYELADDIINWDWYNNSSVNQLNVIIDNAIETACIWHITDKMAMDASFEESNFFRTVPNCSRDFMNILRNIINIVTADIDRYIFYHRNEENLKRITKKWKKANEVKLEQSEANVRSLEEENKKLRTQIGKLDSKIQYMQERTAEQINAEEKERVLELERKNQKLEAQLLQTEQKYKALKDEIQFESEIDEEPDEIPVSFDNYTHYTFIADKTEFTSYFAQIQKAFPNSDIISDPYTLDVNRADFVILMTKYMAHHSTYFKAKDICKTHNIPFIHCRYTNPQMVIRTIKNTSGYRC